MKLIPTMNLRIVRRPFPIAHNENGVINEMRQVLQQQFGLPSGGTVWRDVPVVDEDCPE